MHMMKPKQIIHARYFSLLELTKSRHATERNLPNTPPPAALARLQDLVSHVLDPARERLGLPIVVNSGYRSERVNRLAGGVARSQHIRGEAADITCADNARLLQILRTLPHDQIVVYIDRRGLIRWLHVSYRAEGNRGQELKKYV